MGRRLVEVCAVSATIFVAVAHTRQLRAEGLKVDLRRLEFSTDPSATLYLESPASPGHLAWNIGVWGSYGYQLLELKTDLGQPTVPIEHQVSVDYLASIGLTDRLGVGLLLPTIVYQSGSDLSEAAPDAKELQAVALGDLNLTLKATLVPSGELGGFSFAALGRLSLPTGNQNSFASDGSFGGQLRLLSELSLIVVALRATAGVRIRGVERNVAGLEVQHELPWGAGLSFRPQFLGIDPNGRWQWSVEARGALSLSPRLAKRRESFAVFGPSARYAVGPVSVSLGAEFALAGVTAPNVRAILGLGYAPRFPDVDDDGIVDDSDQCVELAEDLDHFEDSDGCPDFDNDADGVPDEMDHCPNRPEDPDGFEDEDGCPEPGSKPPVGRSP